jgi:hypothetical protein
MPDLKQIVKHTVTVLMLLVLVAGLPLAERISSDLIDELCSPSAEPGAAPPAKPASESSLLACRD